MTALRFEPSAVHAGDGGCHVGEDRTAIVEEIYAALRSSEKVLRSWAARSIHDGELGSERDDFQVLRSARLDDKSERVEQ